MPSSAGLRPSVTAGCSLQELADLNELVWDGPQSAPSAVQTVTGVTLDSRAVRPGDLYAALPGSRAHGAAFAGAAVARGAVALLTDPQGCRRAREQRVDVPALVVPNPRQVLGEVAARIYGQPAEQLRLLAVTGTNGKTTTTYLLDAVLRSAGHTTGLIGTVETRVADQRVPSVRTTPEAPELHALLAAMVERGVDTCSMEVSSQALAQHRVDAAVVDVAGFTNFSQDHLELHGDMATYLAAKAMLFTAAHSRQGVVVVDDEGARAVAAGAGVPVTTLSADPHADSDWRILGRATQARGTDFVLASATGQQLDLRCPLPGDFNVLNAALAAVMLLQCGLSAQQVQQGLARAGGVPGRMEQVGDCATGPLAVVDYAHTPEAVAAVLRTLRPAATGRLVVVLGAGGDRDPGKRTAMGAAAARGADVVVVTDDNPRSEDPAVIRASVLAGARGAGVRQVEVVEVPDRAEAVAEGLRRAARPGDVLVVAGKGHEQGQEVAGVVYPFDDRLALAAALREVRR